MAWLPGSSGRRIAAAGPEHVCQAWHRTSEVNVLVPGNRGAEGWEKGKGVRREAEPQDLFHKTLAVNEL